MQQDIEGLWKNISMEQRYDDGRVTHQLGEEIEGYIYYGREGMMFVALQRGGRKRSFQTGQQWTASPQEKAAAYDDYLSYCGRYTVEGNRVTHFIEVSLYPGFIGQRHLRIATIDSGVLSITARLEEGTPAERTAILRFRRPAA